MYTKQDGLTGGHGAVPFLVHFSNRLMAFINVILACFTEKLLVSVAFTSLHKWDYFQRILMYYEIWIKFPPVRTDLFNNCRI